jgi:general secretion pathway protein D
MKHYDTPEPLREPKPAAEKPSAQGGEAADRAAEEAAGETRFERTPRVEVTEGAVVDDFVAAQVGPIGDSDDKVTVNVEGMALPAFINEVYGNLLQVPFQIADKLKDQSDLVTFRIAEPTPPVQVHRMVAEVLKTYGVSVVKAGDLLRFVPSDTAPAGEPPLLVSGRTLPSVPATHRPVFQAVPIHNVDPGQVGVWLRAIFNGQDLTIKEDRAANRLMLMGPARTVEQALMAVERLDQPMMRGRHSLRVRPAFWPVEEFAGKLVSVLKSEGYSASTNPAKGAIVVLPVPRNNSLVAFATTSEQLAHVKDWIAELDVPGKDRGESGLYYYAVRNTSAANIVDSVSKLLGGGAPSPEEGAGGGAEGDGGQGGGAASLTRKLIADDARNAILFAGSGEAWKRILPIIQRMDQADRLALVEVVIARVTLSDEFRSGFEFLTSESSIGDYSGSGGTLGGLGVVQNGGVAGGGFSYTLNNMGQLRAALNLFASSDRVKILSTPRLMVKSGDKAEIQVGRQVPITTTRSQSTQGTDAQLVQEVQMMETGVLMTVKPTIYAGNRISLDISQTVSEAQPNTLTGIDSPEINETSLQTSVTLEDGGSVLLGGLIEEQKDVAETKVPVLGDIPLLGWFFRSESERTSRQELLMMVVPYIIEGQREAEQLTDAFRDRLNHAPGRGSDQPDEAAPGVEPGPEGG